MKVLPDTSVIVPALLKNHENHNKAFVWLEKMVNGEISGVLSAHSLAEVYATLTRIPPPLRLPPKIAWDIMQKTIPSFEVVALTDAEVIIIINDLAKRDIGGGQVYDALIAGVARKTDVDVLLTFNHNHFLRVAPDLKDRIQEP